MDKAGAIAGEARPFECPENYKSVFKILFKANKKYKPLIWGFCRCGGVGSGSLSLEALSLLLSLEESDKTPTI
jgi:hypothetical protein